MDKADKWFSDKITHQVADCS